MRSAPKMGESGDSTTEKEKEIMAELGLKKRSQEFRIKRKQGKPSAAKFRAQGRSARRGQSVKSDSDLSRLARNVFMDDRSCAELKALLQAKDKYKAAIEEMKAVIAGQDDKIKELQDKIEQQKVLVIKRKQEYNGKRIQKQIQLLENRLHHFTVYYDTILAKNAEFREEIESLQKQKSVFDHIFSRLQQKMDEQKRAMDLATEQATLAREQRVEALANISATKEQCCKDIAQFNMEFRELQRIYSHENKLKAFLCMKLQDRSEFEEQARREEALKEKTRAKSKGESFESYEVAYMRLLKLTENGNIDRLAEEFTEKEKKNFAAFSYITELNDDNERLQKKIQNIQNEIDQLKLEQKKDQDVRHGHLKELEEKLKWTTEEGNRYAYKVKESSKTLDHLKSAVDFLFQQMGCDATEIREHLGETGEVTDQNLMQYFSIIEKKTNDLLLIESFLRYKEVEGELESGPIHNPFLGGSSLVRRVESVSVVPPSIGADSFADVLELFDAPLDHENLRALIQENLEKEKDSDGAEGPKKKPSM